MAAPALGLADLAGLPVHGVSLEHPGTVAAEHWLASLSPAPVLACAHLVRSPRPHVALSLVFAGAPPDSLLRRSLPPVPVRNQEAPVTGPSLA